MAGTRGRWRARLPADPRLRRVLVAYSFCIFVEFASWLVYLLVAYEIGGPVLVGAASVALLVPAFVLVPFVATVGDHMPRGRALSLTYLGVAVMSGIAAVLLAVDAPFWSVLLPGAGLSVLVSLARPMHFAALPLLSHRPGDLVAANALSSGLEGFTVFVGFAVAGVLTERLGGWVVLAAAAGLGLVAAVLTRGLGLPSAAPEDGDGAVEIRAAFEGFRALRGNWGVLALLLLIATLAVVEGSDDTLVVTYNDEVLGLGASGAGLLAGAYGLGIAVGGATQAGITRRRRLAPLVLAGAFVLAVAEASVAFLGALAPAVVLLMVSGIGVSMITVSSRTLLQRSTDNAVLTRVLGIEEGVFLVGLTLGAVVGPVLVTVFGPRYSFIAEGAIIAAIALLAYRWIRELDARSAHRPRELALLSEVPFLAALAPYDLEHLAQVAQWRSVPLGTRVITQGEPGDSYYLVAEGRLSVVVDGLLRDHELGPGEGFGEIALLNGGPRTATIIALTDCELLTLRAEPFLAAVTSSVDGKALATGASNALLTADRHPG